MNPRILLFISLLVATLACAQEKNTARASDAGVSATQVKLELATPGGQLVVQADKLMGGWI